jgi:structural maintenance of chromosome 4
LEISRELLDEPKAKLQQIETNISECTALLTSLAVEIKSSHRNLANAEKKLSSLRDDLEASVALVAKNEARLDGMDEEGKAIVEQHDQVKSECKQLESSINQMSKSMKEADAKRQKLESERIDHAHNLEKTKVDLEGLQDQFKHYTRSLASLKLHNIEALSSLEVNVAQDNEEMDTDSSQSGLAKIDSDDLEGLSIESLKRDIAKLDDQLKSLQPNLQAIQNFKQLQIKFMERVNELDEITQTRDRLNADHEELRKKRLDEFMSGFTKIRLKLKEIYRTVTIEGDAELELVDSLDPFTEGIVLSVRPPKKSWKNVGNLSGGEKTLSSLSLVFALHEFRATPIYVMDEIDAALDFKNVSIIAHYIKERTKNAQFIIISLRNNMFELCDRLFGIYKVRNCTSATYIAPELMELDEKKKKSSSNATANATGNEQLADFSSAATTTNQDKNDENVNTVFNSAANKATPAPQAMDQTSLHEETQMDAN